MGSKKIKALPVQFIEIPGGVILKRGCFEFRVNGEGAAGIARYIVASSRDRERTSEEICENFAIPDRPAIARIIQQLVDRRLLIPADEAPVAVETMETHDDIFYWHFGESTSRIIKRLNERTIVILGVNRVSRQLVTALHASGAEQVRVIDDPLLRNLRLFGEQGELLAEQWPSFSPPECSNQWADGLESEGTLTILATSDFGATNVLRQWNTFCLTNQYHFLPVVLHNLIGYVGPLVIPGQTACFECLRARQNAHMHDPQTQRIAEEWAFEGQIVTGFHPSMASILGDIAALELIKLYSSIQPMKRVGTLIEVDLLAMRMTPRKVLKIPRCAACSSLSSRSSINLNKPSENSA